VKVQGDLCGERERNWNVEEEERPDYTIAK
jgi:hypothetical protein